MLVPESQTHKRKFSLNEAAQTLSGLHSDYLAPGTSRMKKNNETITQEEKYTKIHFTKDSNRQGSNSLEEPKRLSLGVSEQTGVIQNILYDSVYYNIFEDFKSHIATIDATKLCNLKTRLLQELNSIWYEDINNDSDDDSSISEDGPSSTEVRMAFVQLFRTIFDDVFPQASLNHKYAIRSGELNPERKKCYKEKEPDEEQTQAKNLQNTFVITLSHMPIIVVKVKNEKEYAPSDELDVLANYMRILAKREKLDQLYGLLVTAADIQFVKHSYSSILHTNFYPFIPREFLKTNETAEKMDECLRAIICLIDEAVTRYNNQ